MENQKLIVRKTGTTLVGVTYSEGTILATDTRSTASNLIANPNCTKLHYIFEDIVACGAGTAADADRTTKLCRYYMYKHYRKYGKPTIKHCVRFLRDYLFDHGGNVEAALLIGGYDGQGKLYCLSHNGYSAQHEFVSMGSGSLAATGVLEASYVPNMSEIDAINLAVNAVKAGILNDLYSGSNVDVCIINKNGYKVLRNHCVVSKRLFDEKIQYPIGSIKITKEEIIKNLEILDENVIE